MQSLRSDPRFSGVSAQTKTDIIATIGIDINEAKDDIAESKFTQAELSEALHYLLATEAPNNPQLQSFIHTERQNEFTYMGDPFFFSHNDPYFMLINIPQIHHGGGGGNISNDNNLPAEGLIIAVLCACVCIAGCCCVLCTKVTLASNESENVKKTKVSVSIIVGVVAFIASMILLTHYDVLREDIVVGDDDIGPYFIILFLISVSAGLFSGGLVATANNMIPCLPDKNIPKPSTRILEALKDLETVKTLLSKGWKRDGDNVTQCKDFIREVVKEYIQMIACTPVPETSITVSLNRKPAAQKSIFFSSNTTNYNSLGDASSTLPSAPSP
jgi:hypothetical protein